MSAILYPVAANAETALSAPLGRAARESEAAALAQGPVAFVVEAVGPAYGSYDMALAEWAARVDEGPGPPIQPADRYCALREVLVQAPAPRRKPKPIKPVYRDGKRWPDPPASPPRTAWRLSVSYWRLIRPGEVRTPLLQARAVRKGQAGGAVAPDAVQAMARQPLLPVRPQQPLDIGLFEFRPPEAPHIIIPDE